MKRSIALTMILLFAGLSCAPMIDKPALLEEEVQVYLSQHLRGQLLSSYRPYSHEWSIKKEMQFPSSEIEVNYQGNGKWIFTAIGTQREVFWERVILPDPPEEWWPVEFYPEWYPGEPPEEERTFERAISLETYEVLRKLRLEDKKIEPITSPFIGWDDVITAIYTVKLSGQFFERTFLFEISNMSESARETVKRRYFSWRN